MAEQKAKAKGRKIGRGVRKNARYVSERRCEKNKQRRMVRADKDYERNFALRTAEAVLAGVLPEHMPVKVKRSERYPGWQYTEGYGYTRI